ncbi:MAG TPA: RDD family protein [Segeticoccus sp.]|nr:RDD family protein [Segeticoccus sp.]
MASGDGTRVQGDSGAHPELGAYPGQRLGMPEHGRGSVARLGRRVAALVIDWLLCELIAFAFLGFRPGSGTGSWIPLVVFAVENLLLVGTWGSTVGHRLLGMRVIRMDGLPAGPVPGLVRTVLLCLLVPALIWDRDNRGLHDKAAGTVLIRL